MSGFTRGNHPFVSCQFSVFGRFAAVPPGYFFKGLNTL
jgi:hypothetical protein